MVLVHANTHAARMTAPRVTPPSHDKTAVFELALCSQCKRKRYRFREDRVATPGPG